MQNLLCIVYEKTLLLDLVIFLGDYKPGDTGSPAYLLIQSLHQMGGPRAEPRGGPQPTSVRPCSVKTTSGNYWIVCAPFVPASAASGSKSPIFSPNAALIMIKTPRSPKIFTAWCRINSTLRLPDKPPRKLFTPRRLLVLSHPALLIVEEIGYLPLSRDGAVLFFQLINSRYAWFFTVSSGLE